MADTHPDRDVRDVYERLAEKAKAMSALGENLITAGKEGEAILHEEQVGVFLVRKLPDDADALRISIGEPNLARLGSYVVIRGRTSAAIELIERALAALKVSNIESAGD